MTTQRLTPTVSTTAQDRTDPRAAQPARPAGRAAVVVNPTKFTRTGELDRLHADLVREFGSHGWDVVLWLPTTAATLGGAEARAAVDVGVDLVLVVGGDGTIRTVAAELAGTDVALALLPAGTGNLLARNLGVPLNDLSGAVRIACAGVTGAVDVGRLEVDRDGDGSDVRDHLFLVMAGAGFDAALIAGAGTELKRRLGHAAYVVSGVRALRTPHSTISVRPDGEDCWTRAAHGMVVGNCGELTMGLSLMPQADVCDGLLDAVVLLPRTVVEWTRALWSVARRTQAPQDLLPRLRASGLEMRSESPLPVQVDGDVVGQARRIRVHVQPGALTVRRPVQVPSDRTGSAPAQTPVPAQQARWSLAG